jgi:hypothetical protein
MSTESDLTKHELNFNFVSNKVQFQKIRILRKLRELRKKRREEKRREK